MIGMLKVLEHMQLGEQLSGEQQPSQYDEIPALQHGQSVRDSVLVHGARIPDSIVICR
jgi:hypothetical protein